MPFTDLSNLPPAAPARPTGGDAPDTEVRFASALPLAWDALNTAEGPKATAAGTRFRHSNAGKCARLLGYVAAGIPASDAMDLTGVWNTRLGTLIHEEWQAALTEHAQTLWPDHEVTVEVEPTLQVDGFDGSGHADAVITVYGAGAPVIEPGQHGEDPEPGEADDLVIFYELKSVGGFAFKAAIGKARRGTPPEGPKSEHVVQAALGGLARNADQAVVGYLAKECVSVKMADGLDPIDRFSAEWTFDRDTYEPIARAEVDRVTRILALLDDEGQLPARKFPTGTLPRGAEIVDPSKGRWESRDAAGKVVDTGSWWACDYCDHRTLCATTPKGRIPVASVAPVTIGDPS